MTAPRHPSFPPNAAKFPGSTYNWNPGNIASLHKRARDIMPIWTEGVNVVFKKNLDINRVLMMNWVIGNNTPFGFRVGGELSKKIDGTSLVIISSRKIKKFGK